MPKANVNGIELYYEEAGSGPPVLLISGLTADHFMFGFQVPALAPHFRCIVFDNRGVGQSSQPEGPYTFRQMAEDAVALLDHLGVGQAHVVGASMGGAIAQEIAINHPQRVLSAAILCSWPKSTERTRRFLRVWAEAGERLEPSDYLEWVFSLVFTDRLYEAPGALDMFKQQALANPFPQTPAGLRGQTAACAGHDTLDRLDRIQAPTFVWSGARDILLPPEHSRVLAERIKGAEYYEMPDVGHGFFWEQIDETNARLLEWLKRASR